MYILHLALRLIRTRKVGKELVQKWYGPRASPWRVHATVRPDPRRLGHRTRCWDSATCEPLDAEIIAAEVQNSTFFYTPLVFLGRIYTTIWVDGSIQVAQTPTYPVIPSFSFYLRLSHTARRDSSSNVSVRPWQKNILSEAQLTPPYLQAGLTDLDEIWHDGRG